MLEAFGIFNVWWEILFGFQTDGVDITIIFIVAVVVGWAINVLTNYVGKG